MIEYCVPDVCGDSWFKLPWTTRSYRKDNWIGWGWIASDAGENYHGHHDGWECTWPLSITLREDGEDRGTYSVACEMVPHFSARRES